MPESQRSLRTVPLCFFCLISLLLVWPSNGQAASIDVGSVRTVFKNGQASLQGCYERTLRRRPNFKGDFLLKVALSKTGRVKRVGLRRRGRGARDFSRCVRRRVKKWKFPPSDVGPVLVELPLVLSKRG